MVNEDFQRSASLLRRNRAILYSAVRAKKICHTMNHGHGFFVLFLGLHILVSFTALAISVDVKSL